MTLQITLLALLSGGSVLLAVVGWAYRLKWLESEKRFEEIVERNVLLSKDLEHVTSEMEQAVSFAKTLLSRPVTAVMLDEQVMRIGQAVGEVVKALVNNPSKLN